MYWDTLGTVGYTGICSYLDLHWVFFTLNTKHTLGLFGLLFFLFFLFLGIVCIMFKLERKGSKADDSGGYIYLL